MKYSTQVGSVETANNRKKKMKESAPHGDNSGLFKSVSKKIKTKKVTNPKPKGFGAATRG